MGSGGRAKATSRLGKKHEICNASQNFIQYSISVKFILNICIDDDEFLRRRVCKIDRLPFLYIVLLFFF